ncbi:LOB domain-containing protein 15-like isoform X1 [Amaranthus tricolor]|uniref:LOB domain-containing protein 15-like isoform X1 n=2 Tax=Amaranthus tricolor TaxID=29722 RepID=UPI00258485EC|nr:LOB domain-containing protein 15-like isoform X1 [Amaranthus tricolor]
MHVHTKEDEIGKRVKRKIDGANINKSMVASSCYDNHLQIASTGRRHLMGVGPTPPPGTTLNTITPCAACKLLRRRCAEECPFSPYFSPHEPQKFAAVHKVFGASNVSKLLMEVPENQRADAANSLVYEANIRLRDPVYGCMGAISALQQQIQALQAELNLLRAEIIKFKYRQAANHLISATNNSNNPTINHHHPTNNSNNPTINHHHHPNNNSLVNSLAATVIAASLPPQVQSPPHQLPVPPPPPATPPPPAPSVSAVSTPPLSGAASFYTPPPPPSPPTLSNTPTNAGFTCISNDHSVPFLD